MGSPTKLAVALHMQTLDIVHGRDVVLASAVYENRTARPTVEFLGRPRPDAVLLDSKVSGR